MVQAYAVKERIGSLHLPSDQPPPQAILDIPLEAYIPSDDDVRQLRGEVRCEVSAILAENLPFLGDDDERDDTERPFSLESARKSVVVCGCSECDCHAWQ